MATLLLGQKLRRFLSHILRPATRNTLIGPPVPVLTLTSILGFFPSELSSRETLRVLYIYKAGAVRKTPGS